MSKLSEVTGKVDELKNTAGGLQGNSAAITGKLADVKSATDNTSENVNSKANDSKNAVNSSLADHAPSLPNQDDVSPTGAGSAVEGHIPHEG